MHTANKKVITHIQGMSVDMAAKAGVMHIFQHTGKLKSVHELRNLSEREKELFADGAQHYIENEEHPARHMHAQIHYGRVVYLMAIMYYLSIFAWVMSLINISIVQNTLIIWPLVWGWMIVISLLNLTVLVYGMHLEKLALKRKLVHSQRIMAFIVIIVLAVGIISNFIAPYAFQSDINSQSIFFVTSAL